MIRVLLWKGGDKLLCIWAPSNGRSGGTGLDLHSSSPPCQLHTIVILESRVLSNFLKILKNVIIVKYIVITLRCPNISRFCESQILVQIRHQNKEYS